MKLIELSKGCFAKVDDEDFEFLNKYKWNASAKHNSINGGFYAKRSACVNGKTRHIGMMHRIILNAVGKVQIDHIDGDGLNNQKNNLRICSHGQNQQNRTSNRTNNSLKKYKGIYWVKNRVRAEICAGGIKYRLGYFKTEKEAALAYNEAAIKYHGEFAKLNIISE